MQLEGSRLRRTHVGRKRPQCKCLNRVDGRKGRTHAHPRREVVGKGPTAAGGGESWAGREGDVAPTPPPRSLARLPMPGQGRVHAQAVHGIRQVGWRQCRASPRQLRRRQGAAAHLVAVVVVALVAMMPTGNGHISIDLDGQRRSCSRTTLHQGYFSTRISR